MSDRLDWKAAFWAGLVAGAVFMALEMVLVATVFVRLRHWVNRTLQLLNSALRRKFNKMS